MPVDAWLYQICTEVGFYQVHNPQSTESVMSPLINEAFSNEYCDLKVHQRPDVAATNAKYYAPLAQGLASNILFVNGELDPWSVLSFVDKETLPKGLSAHVVAKGSHCTDLTNLKDGLLLGDYTAHLKFNELAKQWLAQ